MARRDYSPTIGRGGRATRARPSGIALLILMFGYGAARLRRQRPEAPPPVPAPCPRGSSRAACPPPRRGGMDVGAIGSFNIKWFGTEGPEPRTEEDVRVVAEVVGRPARAARPAGDRRRRDRWTACCATCPATGMSWGRPGPDALRHPVGRVARVGGPRAQWPDVNRDLERAQGDLRAPLVAPARVGDSTSCSSSSTSKPCSTSARSACAAPRPGACAPAWTSGRRKRRQGHRRGRRFQRPPSRPRSPRSPAAGGTAAGSSTPGRGCHPAW